MNKSLNIDILTLFPEMISGFFNYSIIGRAQKNGLVSIETHNIRDWTEDKNKTTDDRPFGGGAGMILKPEPLSKAIKSVKKENSKVIYLCPDGEKLTSKVAKRLSKENSLVLISGHYEGVDQRIRDNFVDEEISIGDYVLTNGTLAAAVLIDTVSRYVPGVLGQDQSLLQDSFNENSLSFPQYTRPFDFQGFQVPEVLISGNHEEISSWRKKQQTIKTQSKRPDLYKL